MTKTMREGKYHCNYCGKKMEPVDIFYQEDSFFVCKNPKCPSFALLQIPVELLKVKGEK